MSNATAEHGATSASTGLGQPGPREHRGNARRARRQLAARIGRIIDWLDLPRASMPRGRGGDPAGRDD